MQLDGDLARPMSMLQSAKDPNRVRKVKIEFTCYTVAVDQALGLDRLGNFIFHIAH